MMLMASRIHPTSIFLQKDNAISLSPPFISSLSRLSNVNDSFSIVRLRRSRERRRHQLTVRSSGGSSLSSRWEELWKPQERLKLLPDSVPCLSDIIWPSAGAFAAMALLGRLDQMVAHRGLSFTIAPLGAVCAVLFTAPNSPAARKYNMFMAQIGCAAFGVLALLMFGPGWVARGAALAASIAFMTVTGASHPPAASLPLLFIDGAKFHNLNLWYALFPGATGCLLLCLIQEVVTYLKKNCKF